MCRNTFRLYWRMVARQESEACLCSRCRTPHIVPGGCLLPKVQPFGDLNCCIRTCASNNAVIRTSSSLIITITNGIATTSFIAIILFIINSHHDHHRHDQRHHWRTYWRKLPRTCEWLSRDFKQLIPKDSIGSVCGHGCRVVVKKAKGKAARSLNDIMIGAILMINMYHFWRGLTMSWLASRCYVEETVETVGWGENVGKCNARFMNWKMFLRAARAINVKEVIQSCHNALHVSGFLETNPRPPPGPASHTPTPPDLHHHRFKCLISGTRSMFTGGKD